jgi:outer membrane protein OmpA-like peptidoglycan-associated protein
LDKLDSIAQDLATQGKWDSALTIMNKLNSIKPYTPSYIHNTACFHARKGNPDSAFHYLFLIADSMPSQLILSDPDFITLIESPKWLLLENIYFNTKVIQNRIKDTAYAKALQRIKLKDQAYYSELDLEEKQLKPNKEKIKLLWKKKEILNKQNLTTLEQLIQSKGWPQMSKVGNYFTDAAFLVIQHSDYNTMKTYYHSIKEACETGEGDCGAQALLYDRIKTIEGKPQRYGSQVHYDEKKKQYTLYPLEDTLHVNEFREYMGLGLLEYYIQHWNINLKIPRVKDPLAYADSVVFYQDSGKDPKYPYTHGCKTNAIDKMIPIELKSITGKNNENVLVMPMGSKIILQFVDNQIVNYPYQPDLFIKEEGAAGDKAIVYISNDGVVFDSLGITVGGRTSAMDLETIKYSSPVKFIKLVSLNNNGLLPGFDLVHVKGTPMSSVPATYTQKQIVQYLLNALKEESIAAPKGSNQLVDLNDILFDSGKHSLSDSAKTYLDKIATDLKNNSNYRIELNGHTDDIGNIHDNEKLSMLRANEVANYLIAQGIKKNRIQTNGYSYKKPIDKNKNDKARFINRRVELKLIQ